MMVTKINQDKGILMRLPVYEVSLPAPVNERNVLKLYLNDEDALLVGNKEIEFDELYDEALSHVGNYDLDKTKSIHPQKAIILFEQSRGVSYHAYLAVHNELKMVYKALRNDLCMELTSNRYSYEALINAAKEDDYYDRLKDSIHKEIPIRIQEALPSAGL